MAFGDQRFGIIVKARTGQARRELGKLKAESKSTFGDAGQAVQGLTTALGQASVALGAVTAGIAAISLKTSASLETAFSEVATISSFTADETARLRDEVRALAIEVGGNEIQGVGALYQIISAGATSANDASILLGQSVRLAKAGLADLDTTAKALSSTVNSFGVEIGESSERLADMFFETVRLGQTTIPELAGAIGRVAKVADVAGVDVEELLASIAALTKAGLSTDEAVTAVRQALLSIAAPGSQAAQAFKDIGVDAGAAVVAGRGLAGVFEDIGKATDGDIEKLKRLIPNIRAIVAAAVFADEEGLKLLVESTRAIGEGSGAVRTALAEFSDDLEFRLGRAAAKAKGEVADLGRTLTPFAIEVLELVSEQLSVVVALFGDFFGLVVDNGDQVASTLTDIGTALLLVGGALAGNAVASGVLALARALQFLILGVLTAPGGVAAGLLSLANPIAAIGATVGVAAVLIGKHVISLRAAAVEAERIAAAVEDSNQTIQELGEADLSTLETVVGILADFRAQITTGAAPGIAVLGERLAAAGGEAVTLERDLSAMVETLGQTQAAVADATDQTRIFREEQAKAADARFTEGLEDARETMQGFSAETQAALRAIAPGFTEGAISSVQELDALLATLEARLDEIRAAAAAAEDQEETEDAVPAIDASAVALARLQGALGLVREDLAAIEGETGAAFAEVSEAGAKAFGPGGVLSPENIRDLGSAFDDLETEDLVDQLFRFGELSTQVEANVDALGDMLDVLKEIKSQAGDFLTEDQLAAFELIIATVAEAIEEASAEMAARLRELQTELGKSVDSAKQLKNEFVSGAAAFARAMGSAAAQGRNIMDAFKDYVIQQIINAIALEFGKLLFNLLPGGGGIIGNVLFGGTFRQGAPRAIPRDVSVGRQGAGLQVNVGLGPESIVEVVTGDFRARRALFRQGVRPEQLAFDRL